VHLSSTALHAVLLGLTGVAAITDVREGKVFNRLTYPGIVLGIALNGLGEPAGIGWGPALLGFLVGFGALLVAYVAGGLGGGDVKLMGMVGAFLGPLATLYALLYTFLVGALLAFTLIVWKEGIVGVFVRLFQGLGRAPGERSRSEVDTSNEGREHAETGPEEDDDGRDPLRLPFAVAVLVGTAWVVVEQAAGRSLLDLLSRSA
jgi:prepilin peptidase CpaA